MGDENVTHQVLPQVKSKACSRKRRDGVLRKAPQAPRRFKSSYILFFMAKQDEIKSTLPDGSSVSVSCPVTITFLADTFMLLFLLSFPL